MNAHDRQAAVGPTPVSLPENEVKDLFRAHGISAPHQVLVRDPAEGEAFVDGLDEDVFVLKLSMEELVHKSAVGGVVTGVDRGEVGSEVGRLLALGRDLEAEFGALAGVLVEPDLGRAAEVALGFHVDASLGPMVMVADGGTDIETKAVTSFAPAPIDIPSARELVARWRAKSLVAALLTDRDLDSVADAVVGLAGEAGVAFAQQADSIDVNPLLVSHGRAQAVDGVLQRPARPDTQRGTLQWIDDLASESFVRAGDLAPLMDPSTVAVVGASTDPLKPGYRVVKNLRDFGFQGKIAPIHPSAQEICGYTAYAAIDEVPFKVDKAIVMVGSAAVPKVVAACVARQVPVVQVYSAGFSEFGEAELLERQLLDAIAGTETRVVGPNCWGAYSPRSRLTTTWPGAAGIEDGDIAFVSQSGTHFVDVVRRANARHLSLYGAVSIGNSLDVAAHECAEFYLADPRVRVLGLYLEGTADHRLLAEVISRSPKPVVLMRGGRTDSGGRAATSHTAALSSDDRVWNDLMVNAGSCVVESIEEMVDTLEVFSTTPVVTGRNLLVMGTGGGVAVSAADEADRLGLQIPSFTDSVQSELAERFGAHGTSMANPIDVAVWHFFPKGRSAVSSILDAATRGGDIDSSIVYLDTGSILDMNEWSVSRALMDSLCEDLSTADLATPTSLVLRSGGAEEEQIFRDMSRQLRPVGITVFNRIQDAVAAHARLHRWSGESEFEGEGRAAP